MRKKTTNKTETVKTIKLTPVQIEKLREVAKYGMRDQDIAQIFGLTEKELIQFFFNDLYEGRLEGKEAILKAAFEMSQSGVCPTLTKFWLQVQEKWIENHEQSVDHYNKQKNQEEEEYDFSQLNRDELRVYEKLREKAKKIRI